MFRISACYFVSFNLHHKKCACYFVYTASSVTKINACFIVWSVLLYRNLPSFFSSVFSTLEIHLLFCQVYLYQKSVPIIFSSTSSISNISKYQQNISLGIGQMLVLLWITYILGFKLLHESKLAKILKWSQASDFRFLSTDFLRIFVAITHFHFLKVYIYFAKRKVWSDNLKAIYINLYRVWIIVLHFKESFRDLQSIKI